MPASVASLLAEYQHVSSTAGLEAATRLANAISTAERVESDRHWGVFSNDRELKVKTRLRAWQLVARQREALDEIVHVQLAGIVRKLREADAEANIIQQYESDIVLKSGILVSIGRGNLTQDEVFALLAVWAAAPIRRSNVG